LIFCSLVFFSSVKTSNSLFWDSIFSLSYSISSLSYSISSSLSLDLEPIYVEINLLTFDLYLSYYKWKSISSNTNVTFAIVISKTMLYDLSISPCVYPIKFWIELFKILYKIGVSVACFHFLWCKRSNIINNESSVRLL